MTAVVLDYSLSESWNRRSPGLDLQVADETTLRYQCFLGDVVFKVGIGTLELEKPTCLSE